MTGRLFAAIGCLSAGAIMVGPALLLWLAIR